VIDSIDVPGFGGVSSSDSFWPRDYPVVQGCLLFTAVVYVAVNRSTDLLIPVRSPGDGGLAMRALNHPRLSVQATLGAALVV